MNKKLKEFLFWKIQSLPKLFDDWSFGFSKTFKSSDVAVQLFGLMKWIVVLFSKKTIECEYYTVMCNNFILNDNNLRWWFRKS